MLSSSLSFGVASCNHFLTLCLALLIDLGVGEMGPLFRFVPHPVVALGRSIERLEQKLNRPYRSPRDRRARGGLMVVFLCLLGGGMGLALHRVVVQIPYGWGVEAFLAATLIAQRSLYDHVKAVADALRDNGPAGGLRAGRQAVSRIVGRDPEPLDHAGVCRAALESCAENFSDGVVAPVFWYALLGLPGLVIYKTVNTLDSMIGHKSARYRDFGWASARVDDLLNLVPARLSGLLLCCAALFVSDGKPRRAWQIMVRDAGKHRSPNAGWPEAACAGALGLALGGPRAYAGEGTLSEPWIGDGRTQATEADIYRALRLMAVGCLLQGALLGVAALALA